MNEAEHSLPDSDPQALPLGTPIEGFLIEGVLGSGGFSYTYLARDVELDRLFVLKEHFPTTLCSRDPDSLVVTPRSSDRKARETFAWSVENFLEEAESLSSLDHPSLVRILGGFEAFGTAYGAMPFVSGTSFQEQISHRHAGGFPFEEEEICGFLWRMLDVLDYLHPKGIYHQRIRPENILINEEGVPRLISFGEARRLLCERLSFPAGKSGYTPPEQTKIFCTIDSRSDLYALGATLAEAITGELPTGILDDSTFPTRTLLASRSGLACRYSRILLGSIDRALEPLPEDRFPDTLAWRGTIWPGTLGNIAGDRWRAVAKDTAPIPPLKRKREKVIPETVPTASDTAERKKTAPIPIVAENSDNTLLEPEEAPPAGPAGSKFWGAVAIVASLALLIAMYWYGTNREIPLDEIAMPVAKARPVAATPDATALAPKNTQPEMLPHLAEDPPPLPESAPVAKKTEHETISIPESPAAEEPLVAAVEAPSPTVIERPSATAPSDVAPPDVEATSEMEGSEAGEHRNFGGVEMVWCPPGTFTMGSPWNEKGRFMDETPHQVTLTRGYWIAKTETTQEQWERVMGEVPSGIRGPNLPVDRVTWFDVHLWLDRMNELDPLPTGWKWGLPTEAQWEYACRAGTTTAVYSGSMEILGERNAPALDEIAWYGGNSSVGYTGVGVDTSEWEEKQYPGGNAGIREVGGKLPNAWGLHDMLGNVWEWCLDWTGPYPIGFATDPTGPPTGLERVMRGGNWANGPAVTRSAVRSGESPGGSGDGLGFRSVIVRKAD